MRGDGAFPLDIDPEPDDERAPAAEPVADGAREYESLCQRGVGVSRFGDPILWS